jgi:hypothetical protein
MAIIEGKQIVDIESVNKNIQSLIDGLELIKLEAKELSNVITKDLKVALNSIGKKEDIVKNVSIVEDNIKKTEIYKEQIKAVTALEKELSNVKSKLEVEQKKNIKSTEKQTVEYQKNLKANADRIKQSKLEAIANDETSGTVERLQAKIALLNIERKKLIILTEQDKQKHKELTIEVDRLDNELQQFNSRNEARIKNIGNYAYNIQGLKMSFNQITREAPAFANSLNTGFMAISNNLPMLSDEIKRLKERNAQLNAEGIKTPSIFKSIMSAMFSWQTAMSLGITLLTIYGGKIVAWIGNLLKGEKALKSMTDAQNELNESFEVARENSKSDIANLDLLYNVAKDVTKEMGLRKDATKQLIATYPEYFKNIKEEVVLAGKATEAYLNQRNAIYELAKTEVIKDKISENVKKEIELNIEKNRLIAEEIKLSVQAEEEKDNLQQNNLQRLATMSSTSNRSTQALINTEQMQTTIKLDETQKRIASIKSELSNIAELNELYLSNVSVIEKVTESGKEKIVTEEDLLEKLKAADKEITELWANIIKPREKPDAFEEVTALEAITDELNKQHEAADKVGKKMLGIEKGIKQIDAAAQGATGLEKFQYKLQEIANAFVSFNEKYGDSISEITGAIDTALQASQDNWSKIIASYETKISEQESIVKNEQMQLNKGLANSYNEESKKLNQLQKEKESAVQREKQIATTRIRIAEGEAAATMLSSVANIFVKSTEQMGAWGVIAAIASIATMLAQFYSYEQQIKQLEHGGEIKEGGEVKGKSHKEGGIDVFVGKSKRPSYNIEGGEFVVSKKSYSRSKQLINLANQGKISDKDLEIINTVKNERAYIYNDINSSALSMNTHAIDRLTNSIKKSDIVDKNGNLIRIIGNSKTIFKN